MYIGLHIKYPLFLSQFLFTVKGPAADAYGRTAALRLVVQPCEEDYEFFSVFPSNEAPVE
jgi:hypothetical protein